MHAYITLQVMIRTVVK